MIFEQKDREAPQETDDQRELQALRALVKKHRVCWEVWPDNNPDGSGRTVQVGFDLRLEGTYEHADHETRAGCPECVAVYEDLRRIARWILPDGDRDSTYELGAFDGAIHYAPERKLRPEIELPIRILHRHEFEAPVDKCETSCLQEMEEKLRLLGARRKYWRDGPASP